MNVIFVSCVQKIHCFERFFIDERAFPCLMVGKQKSQAREVMIVIHSSIIVTNFILDGR